MRVTTDFWVSALLRRAFSAGCFGAIEKHGAREAGAVFIVRRGRNGEIDLLSPAPQTSYDAASGERRFVLEMQNADPLIVGRRLESEARFDSDMWIVEIEADANAIEDWIGPTMHS